MAYQHISAETSLDIPYPQRRVSGSGDGRFRVRHLQTSHGRRVSTQRVDTCSARASVFRARILSCQYDSPGTHVPHPDVAITAATDQSITPGDHSPYPHHMTLESNLATAICVEDVYFGII